MIYRANLNNKKPQGKPAFQSSPTLGMPVNSFDSKLINDISEQAPNIVNPISEANKVKKKKVNFKMIFGLLILFIVVLGGLLFYDRIASYASRVVNFNEDGTTSESCTNILNPNCWTEAFRPQLKQTDGFTSALIIGTDTRAGKGSLMNTDSIIVVTFNHATQELMMTSIPRDFWSHTYSTKINAVYAITYKNAKAKYNDEFYYFKEEVSKIVDKPIHYIAKVRFEGVTGLVDKLGGVEVCPPDAFKAKYPIDTAKGNEAQWRGVEFSAGCQTIDGETALVYSRFRYLYKGPSYLASDFSRAARQQEVIDAIKVKALAEDLTLEQRAETYWSLFQSFNEMIEVDISFEDLLAGLALIDTFDREPLHTVLDPNFGGINKIIYTDSNPEQGYTIKARSKDYSNIHAELEKIWDNTAFYKETPIIVVRNQTGEKELPKDSLAIKLKSDLLFYNSWHIFNDAKSDKLAGVHIFDFTNGEKYRSLKVLKEYLGVEEVGDLPEEFGISRSNKNEDFLIVVGPESLPTATPEVTEAE